MLFDAVTVERQCLKFNGGSIQMAYSIMLTVLSVVA